MLGVRKAAKELTEWVIEVLRENERLKDENEQLKNENAMLRSAEKRDVDVMEALNLSLEESQAENSELREVLENCVILLTDHQFSHLPELRDETFKTMRELGIEV